MYKVSRERALGGKKGRFCSLKFVREIWFMFVLAVLDFGLSIYELVTGNQVLGFILNLIAIVGMIIQTGMMIRAMWNKWVQEVHRIIMTI